jgi:hypothetical protein
MTIDPEGKTGCSSAALLTEQAEPAPRASAQQHPNAARNARNPPPAARLGESGFALMSVYGSVRGSQAARKFAPRYGAIGSDHYAKGRRGLLLHPSKGGTEGPIRVKGQPQLGSGFARLARFGHGATLEGASCSIFCHGEAAALRQSTRWARHSRGLPTFSRKIIPTPVWPAPRLARTSGPGRRRAGRATRSIRPSPGR